MTDKYRIDSQKLIYHPSRVSEWWSKKLIYPIYMEVSPAGVCNHRCTYCGLDFMEYQKRYLDTPLFKERLVEMGKLGLRSIMYAGEGEPFLHKDMADIIVCTKKSGIDIGITTNGVLFTREIAEEVLPVTEWIKVSINGATPYTYAKIHRSKKQDFEKVVANMTAAAEIKKQKSLRCTLGMQLLLLPENRHEVIPLVEMAKGIGMDYVVVKPYSQHPQSKTDIYKDIKYDEFIHLSDETRKYNSENFNVIFRLNTMKKWDSKTKPYKCCLALPFWSYIDSGGNVWGCSVYLLDDRFYYGNIFESTFKEIWEGERRRKSLEWVESELDVSDCRVNCRMDEINKYLWELKNPPHHVNFI